jgi:hypothetical protein
LFPPLITEILFTAFCRNFVLQLFIEVSGE